MTIPLATLAILLAMVLDNDIQAAEVTGVWTSEFESPIGRMKYTFDLKADGEKIEGKATRLFEGETLATKLTEGSLEGDEVSFVEVVPVDDRRIRIEYRGKIAGDEIHLTREVGDFAKMPIVARRDKSLPPIAGKWQAEFATQVGKQKYLYSFTVKEGRFSGKATADIAGTQYETALKELKFENNEVSFLEPLNFGGTELQIRYKGQLSGSEIKFTREVGEFATEKFTAKQVR